MKKYFTSIAIIACLVSPLVLRGQTTEPAKEAKTDDSCWKTVLEAYNKAKTAGEKVADDAKAWLREELDKASRWEYKVVELQLADNATVETELNKLGADRWECFWVEQARIKTIMFFKRPVARSLPDIPAQKLRQLLEQPD